MKKNLRIVFMGTPEFAVASLESLLDHYYHIVGVVTVADKPAGRGKKLQMSAVKKFALEKGLKVLTPTNLKDSQFIEALKELQPDLQIVVAFRMLPEVVWGLPALGSFNLHASLLPQYRGAAPINHAIINGEKETGVTTFFLDRKIDTGNVILQRKCPIDELEDAGSLHDKLMNMGANLIIETLQLIENREVQTKPQNSYHINNLKEAPKIFKDDCRINWNAESTKIIQLIRGLSPYPAAWTQLTDKEKNKTWNCKIYKVLKTEHESAHPIGKLYATSNGELFVSTKDYNIQIVELQIEGKKRMMAADFLRGFDITESIGFSD